MMNWDKVVGYFDFQDIYDEAMAKGGVMVEVGTLFGKSAIYMAQKMKERNIPGKLTVVDTWEPWHDPMFYPDDLIRRHGSVYNTFLYFIKECEVEDKLDIVRQDSYSASLGRSCDFVFIDADHSYESVRQDIKCWLPTICTGGMIGGHDYDRVYWPGVVQAVDEAFGSKIEVRNKSWLVHI